MKNKLLIKLSAAIVLAFNSQILAFAEPARGPSAVKEIAMYQGANRQERLVSAAKKEGEVMIYSSMPGEDLALVTAAFEEKYGIKAKVWRASATKTLQRVVTEARAKRHGVDIIETNGPELEAMHREQILQEVKSPYLADLIPQALSPHREWVGTRLNIYAVAYNTKKVKKEDLPKRYEDLLHPRWKGNLGVESTNDDWFAGVVGELGEAKGMKLFNDIAATNGFSTRIGNTLLAKMVASGEVPLGLTVYNYKAEQMKREGADIDWYVIPPAIARANGVAVTRNAPHPNAAVLFFDFMLNQAQPILLTRDFVPTSKKVETKLNKMPLKFVDNKVFLDEQEKWSKLYQDVLKGGAK